MYLQLNHQLRYCPMKPSFYFCLHSGVPVIIFWTSNLVFDYIVYIVPIAAIFAIESAVTESSLCFDQNCYIAVLFALYGWANIPLTYLASQLFDRSGDVFSWLTLYHLLTGGYLHLTREPDGVS